MKLNKLLRKLTTCWKRWVNRLEFFEFDGVFGPYKRKEGDGIDPSPLFFFSFIKIHFLHCYLW